jgi:hypothetical protein
MIITTDTFTFQSAGITLGDCNAYCDLEVNYLGTILGAGTRTFDYVITTAGNGDRTLVITNPEGDIAVHGDFILGTQDVKNTKISLFPNPVENRLRFSVEAITIANIKVFTVAGTEVFYSDLVNENQIDTSFLNDGLYFLQISDDKGNKYIQKFIKQ